MYHIFLSYSRIDSDWVDRLHAELESRGFEAWLDRRDLPLNLPWLNQISDAVEECALFVFCESEAASSSEACASERQVAERQGRPETRVSVGESVDEVVDQVEREVGLLSPDLRAIVEVEVLARDWDRAGRPAGKLPAGDARKRFRRAQQRQERSSELTRELMAASRRKSIRRGIFTATVTLVIGAFLPTVRATFEVTTERRVSHAKLVNRMYAATNAHLAINRSVYEGLKEAGEFGKNDSALDASVQVSALADPSPDDVVRVPGGAKSFAVATIGTTIELLDGNGDRWSRNAKDTDVHSASKVPAGPPKPQAGTDVKLSKSGVVQLFSGGALDRRIVADWPARVAVMSPDSRYIAVGTIDSVEVFDTDVGVRRMRLRGASPVDEIAWSDDGSRIWALADGEAVSWKLERGETILDEPQKNYRALVRSSSSGQVWLVERSGTMREISLADGTTGTQIELGSLVKVVAGDAKGERAAVVTEAGVQVVDLRSHRSRKVTIPACESPDSPAFGADGKDLWFVCGGATAVRVDSQNQELLESLDGDEEFTAVEVDPATGDVYLAGAAGQVFQKSGTKTELLTQTRCKTAATGITVAMNGEGLLPFGQDFGQVGCTELASRESGSWEFYPFTEQAVKSRTVFSAAFAPDARTLVEGYTDGTLVVRPPAKLQPAERMTMVATWVRTVLPIGGSGDFLVLDRGGRLTRITVDPGRLSNAAIAKEARRRLQRARELELTKW